MTQAEKYKMIGDLIDNPTHLGLARAFLACSDVGGTVSHITDGIQVEDPARSRGCGRDMDISPEHVEDIDMTVVKFYKLLIDLADAGGMASHWPGKIRVSVHISWWADISVK